MQLHLQCVRAPSLNFALALAVLICSAGLAHSAECTPKDLDCDGIPDALEHSLLETFRPFFRFSRDNGDDETFRPQDVGAYLRSSEIDGSGKEGDNILVGHSAMVSNPWQMSALTNGGGSSNIVRNASRTNYYVNPDNDGGRRGVPWPQALASRRVGLYGHVVPIHIADGQGYSRTAVPSGDDASNPLYYKIEYWQFFGYSSNNKPLDLGDHEGDWDTVQVIVKPANFAAGTPLKITSVLFYAHGKELAFDMTSKTDAVLMDGGTVTEFRGSNYNLPVPNLHDDSFMEGQARNHVLRMFKDQVTGDFTHPVVFVEHGGHEFWPSPYWEMYGAQKHGGDDTGHFYLAATPPNLGEVEHPLSEDPFATQIVQFNGYWGTYSRALPGIFKNNPPPGPPLHYGWTYPVDSSVRWQLKGLEY